MPLNWNDGSEDYNKIYDLRELLKKIQKDIQGAPSIQLLDGKFYFTIPEERAVEIESILKRRS